QSPRWKRLTMMSFSPDAFSKLRLQMSGPGLVKASQNLFPICLFLDSLSQSVVTVGTRSACLKEVLQWFLKMCYNRGTASALSLKGQLPISRDMSKSLSLQVSFMAAKDLAMYYCVRVTMCSCYHRGNITLQEMWYLLLLVAVES
uniref:Uncharacterized protein n=1 Tax=Loxodonta africana TaxID=9785 RepID=G3ULR8_LOXAF